MIVVDTMSYCMGYRKTSKWHVLARPNNRSNRQYFLNCNNDTNGMLNALLAPRLWIHLN